MLGLARQAQAAVDAAAASGAPQGASGGYASISVERA